jgi:hypothetical protein
LTKNGEDPMPTTEKVSEYLKLCPCLSLYSSTPWRLVEFVRNRKASGRAQRRRSGQCYFYHAGFVVSPEASLLTLDEGVR